MTNDHPSLNIKFQKLVFFFGGKLTNATMVSNFKGTFPLMVDVEEMPRSKNKKRVRTLNQITEFKRLPLNKKSTTEFKCS